MRGVPEWVLTVFSSHLRDMVGQVVARATRAVATDSCKSRTKDCQRRPGHHQRRQRSHSNRNSDSIVADFREDEEDESVSDEEDIGVDEDDEFFELEDEDNENNENNDETTGRSRSSSGVSQRTEGSACRCRPFLQAIPLTIPGISFPVLKLVIDLLTRGSVEVPFTRVEEVREGLALLQVTGFVVQDFEGRETRRRMNCVVTCSGTGMKPSRVFRSKSVSHMMFPIRESIEQAD